MTISDAPTQEDFERRRMELADHILEHPEEFDMHVWGYETQCGTVGCLAGNAALQAAREGLCEIVWEKDPYSSFERVFNSVVGSGFKERLVPTFARDYLGLVDGTLFYRYDLTPETVAKALLEKPYRGRAVQ